MALLSKKKKTGTAEAAETVVASPAGKRRQQTILMAGLPSVAIAVLLSLGVSGGLFYLADTADRQQHEAMATVYRQHHLATLDAFLGSHEAAVVALSDAQLLPYMAESAETNSLAQRFPGALYARVVPAALDPAVPNGLSFAHQDMVLRVADGKKVTPEISFYEKEQVVTFARPLMEGNRVAAVMLLSMPFKPLADALTRFAPEAGSLELVQRNGAERAVILTTTAPREVGAFEVASPTRNPGWEVRFAPVQSLGRENPIAMMILGLGVLSALLVGGLLLAMLIMLQKRMQHDADALDVFCENFLRYGTRKKPPVHFESCTRLLGSIEQYGAELRAGKVIVRHESQDSLSNLPSGGDAAELLGGAPAPVKAARPAASASTAPAAVGVAVPAEIFRAYDIRGIVGKGLDEAVARSIGLAIGSEALARGEQTVVVGRDGRLSGSQMNAALIDGLRASGRDVIDVGMVPTPVLYFAAKTIGTGTGVMITGSHNPGDYNGFKIMIAGDTLAGDEIQALRQRIEKGEFTAGGGNLSQRHVVQDYVDRVSGDIVMARPLKVVVDAGNGVAGAIAPRVLEALGCEVVPLFCEVDGNFPNHHPDPSKPENLEDLIGAVAANGADIGIAFDGDADRIGIVTPTGKNIFPDRLMMLLAKHVLTTNPGADIIFDVKCTRDLSALISRLGGRPVMSKTGHSFIKSKLKETGAALAGEMSGHIFFNDRWFGFDDAIYAAGRVLEILSLESDDADVVFAEFPENPSTPEITIPVADSKKFALVDALKSKAKFADANIITIDGLRVELPDAWGLIRASNTSPCIVARFEGRTPAALAAVQSRFRTLLASVDSSLEIPF
ncbi:MAG: phosphomannomutase/phosphoglucomutase [Gammaproteobacteria bacterium]